MKKSVSLFASLFFLLLLQLTILGCMPNTASVPPQGVLVDDIDENSGDALIVDSDVELPGSRAEKDHILHGRSAEAQAIYDKARANEKIITPVMLQIAAELNAQMVGLQYSVKTASSVEDKIQRRLKESGGTKSDEQIVAEMGDIVRYTLLAEHNDLVATTQRTSASLQALGYKVIKLDNRYLTPNASYKGIHLDVVSPEGQVFELQIHSPESMAIKNAAHILYEEARSVNTAPDRAKQLMEEMRTMWGELPMPKDIETLTNYSIK